MRQRQSFSDRALTANSVGKQPGGIHSLALVALTRPGKAAAWVDGPQGELAKGL